MCIVFLALNTPDNLGGFRVLANRDEFVARPTEPVQVWQGEDGLIAGRDLEAGGTWLGVTAAGRFAAITNVRAPGRYQTGARSRGALVLNWITGGSTLDAFADELLADADTYNPFNLVFGTAAEMRLYDGVRGSVSTLAPGVHAISNGSPAEVWPKMQRGRDAYAAALAQGERGSEALLPIARDAARADDTALPDTGVPKEIERRLSSVFIPHGDHGFGHYGTVSTTLLDWTPNGGSIQEWNWRRGLDTTPTVLRW